MNRRDFLRSLAAGAATTAAGIVLPELALLEPEPVRRFWQVPRGPVIRRRESALYWYATDLGFDQGSAVLRIGGSELISGEVRSLRDSLANLGGIAMLPPDVSIEFLEPRGDVKVGPREVVLCEGTITFEPGEAERFMREIDRLVGRAVLGERA